MQHRPLGRSGLTVSSIGLGCVTFGREIDRETSFAVLDHAREQAITLFDTAEAYGGGRSETVLGDWLAARRSRDDIVLATKVSGELTRERVLTSAEDSLRRLRTDRIDLFQLHNWDDATPLDETLSALDLLVQQGKVRAIGVSNWNTWHLCKALLRAATHGGMRIESVQPPYNLVQREIELDLLPLCVDQQIGITSYSPLGAGFLTGKYRRGGKVPQGTRFDIIPGHQPIYFTDPGFRVLEGLRDLSRETGRSMIDLSLAWVLSRPGITSMLIGARSPAHVDQAVAAEQAGLSAELRMRLEKL
jgi:aryl-alcohol dehydrogenase-like predicted oxidoreductase